MNEEEREPTVESLAQSGDLGALRALFERHSRGLYRFCLVRLGREADAEDAVQDVFLRAYRSLSRYDTSRPFTPWLYSIAANLVKNRYARAASERAVAEAAAQEAMVSSEPDAEEAALEVLAAAELRRAVAALSEGKRRAVELFYFGGLSVKETAFALGLAEEAVKARLFRARRELSYILGEDGQPPKGGEGK